MQSKTSVEVLVATMHQRDFSKVEEMKIQSDVLFANQAEEVSFSQKKHDIHTARMVTTTTRGLGMNRNIALAYATGDILLIADDDVIYNDGYSQTVKKAFLEHPDADAIIFNVDVVEGEIPWRRIKESKRVHIFNALNYGSVRIAVRRDSILRNRLCFSTLFGSGAVYSSGEDSLFIRDMLRSKFRIYTSPETIATVYQKTSTWFHGYTEKYIYDKGALFCAVFPGMGPLFCLQYLVRHPEVYKEAGVSFYHALKIMLKGSNEYSHNVGKSI